MRILSFFQKELGWSRRKAFRAITDGEIVCNGSVVESSKYEVSDNDHIVYDHGKSITVSLGNNSDSKQLVLFHKPVGYVVSKDDKHNATIYDILPSELQNYYYIGRLDKNSEGLLLLTNDRMLVNTLQHPSFDISKEYVVDIDYDWNERSTRKVLKGLRVDNEGRERDPKHVSGCDFLRCIGVKLFEGNLKKLTIVLKEGKKRHIRRLLRALGYEVQHLVRVKFGSYLLDGIEKGKVKYVNKVSKC